MIQKCLPSVVIIFTVILVAVEFASSVAIYRDTDLLKKTQTRGGRQFNVISHYDDDDGYPMSQSRFRESARWESAEWPKEYTRGGDDTYESEDRPYSWFYYNKYLSNGRFNYLYNGPQNDDRAGIGPTRNNRPPQILPRPSPSFRQVPNRQR